MAEGSMKAAVFKGIEHIAVEDREIPACPPGGLLIKVHACGICGGDVRNYHNGLKGGYTERIMGHEIAGEIVEVSADIKKYKRGDRVALAPDVSCGECYYCKRGMVNLCENHRMLGTHYEGGFAQYIALTREVLEHGFIEFIPEGMSYDHAAFAEPCAGVLACQDYNSISYGDTVVVIGDGPVGCLHMEAAKSRGAGTVIMLARGRMRQAEAFGFEHLIYNRNTEEANVKVKKLIGPGADVVICAVPNAEAQKQALELVRKRGRVVIYGGLPKSNPLTTLDSNRIHYDEIMVLGSFSYPATGLYNALKALHTETIHADMYLNAKVGLGDLTKGMDMVTRGEALKVIVDPWLN